MEKEAKIPTGDTVIYLLSRFLERISYYGFRSVLIIYMANHLFSGDFEKTAVIFSFFAIATTFSQLPGALLGDLVLGNRKAMILGGVLQGVGILCLTLSSVSLFYTALVLITVGNGLYTPNITAQFGRQYLAKTRLLDWAYTLLFLIVLLGASGSGIFMGIFGPDDYNTVFMVSGIVTLISTFPLFFIKEYQPQLIDRESNSSGFEIGSVVLAIVSCTVFWGVYEIASKGIYDITLLHSQSSELDLPRFFFHSIQSAAGVIMAIVMSILSAFFFGNRWVKLIVGFGLMGIAYSMISQVQGLETSHSLMLIAALFVMGIAEVFISPIVNAIITRYANPKYLATLLSLAFIPSRLLMLSLANLEDVFMEQITLITAMAAIIMSVSVVGLIIFNYINKKNISIDHE